MRKWFNKQSLTKLLILAFVELCLMVLFIYFTYAFTAFLWKSFALVAQITFFFLFIHSINAALKKTKIAKKKLPVSLVFLFTVAIYFISSYLIGSTEVLLLLPFSALLVYWAYIRENFVEIQPHQGAPVKSHVEALRSYLNRQTDLMMILVFILMVISLLFIKGILPIPNTFGSLYDVSLTVYAVIFSVVTAFGVLGLGRDEDNPLHAALKKPLLGLAHMCIAFFLISLVGTILGADIEASLFVEGAKLGKAFSWETLGVGVIRILLIEGVIISFPFTLVYLYVILRAFLLRSTSEPVDL